MEEATSLILEKLTRLEEAVAVLAQRQMVKDWYTTAEAAKLLNRSEFTVREWCRHGRIRAEKRGSGRGSHHAWVVSHQEILRFEREGLLPLPKH